jgi:homoserine dehydrogenase
MDTKFAENWQEYTQGALKSAKELETITTTTVEKLTAKQIGLANVAFETTTKYISAFSEVKGYQNFQDIFATQSKLASEFNEKFIETARGAADILTESREAYQAWLEQGLKVVTANADFTLPTLMAVKKPVKKAA